jgi:hypothetical protein
MKESSEKENANSKSTALLCHAERGARNLTTKDTKEHEGREHSFFFLILRVLGG